MSSNFCPAWPSSLWVVPVSTNSRFTIRRITSRGAKCSPAVSLLISANLRISFSNTAPI
jgi:hypothetical protein